jgi:hypothetical protein
MMAGMPKPSPRMPGPVYPEDLAKIEAAKAVMDAAIEAYRTSIADALKAGASVRKLSAATGLAMQTISDWGHARGWPTPEQDEWLRMMGFKHDSKPGESKYRRTDG